MTRDTRIQSVAGAVLGACLVVSGFIGARLTASAGRHKLVYTDTAEAGQPPEVALGVALGALRGLFVNYLWMRANDLKEAGKYHEAIQLSSIITRLQPRFPRVWVFHAWNMAYNISVTTQTKDERWQWVQAGIRLLRSEGIPANPNDMLLHKELAWIFEHKIQGYTDDANLYYKQKHAEEWTIVLGPPPAPGAATRDRAGLAAEYAAWLQPIADAPATLDGLYAQVPGASELVSEIRTRVGDDLGVGFLRRYELHRGLQSSARRALIEKGMGPKNIALDELIKDPRFEKAWPPLLAHARRRVLEDVYNMEPARMIRYTLKYGPMDWRHAASHAVYWSARGVENNLTRWREETKLDYDFINTDRITIQGVQELARSGEIYFSFFDFATTGAGFFLASPSPPFVQTYGDILGELIDRSWADQEKRVYSFYAAGYENFLADNLRFFYRRGQLDVAEELYHRLRTFPGQNINDSSRADRLSLPINEFIEKEMVDRYESPYVAVQEVVGSLQGAFVSGLLGNDIELFRTQLEYAKRAHRFFMEKQLRVNAVDSQSARMEQMPSDFRLVAGEVFFQFCSSLDLEDAERVYDAAPNDLRLFAYDLFKERFGEELAELKKSGGRSFEETFLEPEGIEAHRAEVERRQKELEAAPKRPAEQK